MSIKEPGESANSESQKKGNPELVPEIAIRDPRVERVIDFMKANLDRRIHLIDLARVANLSTFRFSHLFKTDTGLPPGEFLIRLRMEKARELLASTRLSVKEIRAITGYANSSTFISHFRRYFGLSPSEYRKNARP